MRPAVDLSIIIVNWNSARYVRKCLETVYARTRELRFEVVVVDNATYDGCGEMLAREFPDAVFIQSAENLGFARANNLGFEQARGGTLLFLNPDTEVHSPAIATLYQALGELPRAGAVGARLLNTDGTVQASCIQSFPTILNQLLDSEFLRTRRPRSPLWGIAPLFVPDAGPTEVEVISGAGLMIRRDVFEQAGKFSAEYFMYAEDLDLCFKVRQEGFLNYYIPQASIVHHGGGSSRQSHSEFSTVMMRESICRFLTKTRGRAYGFCYRVALLLGAACRLLLLLPLAAARVLTRNQYRATVSIHKSLAIAKWALGRQTWLQRYR